MGMESLQTALDKAVAEFEATTGETVSTVAMEKAGEYRKLLVLLDAKPDEHFGWAEHLVRYNNG
jgi:hypothetical protein